MCIINKNLTINLSYIEFLLLFIYSFIFTAQTINMKIKLIEITVPEQSKKHGIKLQVVWNLPLKNSTIVIFTFHLISYLYTSLQQIMQNVSPPLHSSHIPRHCFHTLTLLNWIGKPIHEFLLGSQQIWFDELYHTMIWKADLCHNGNIHINAVDVTHHWKSTFLMCCESCRSSVKYFLPKIFPSVCIIHFRYMACLTKDYFIY